MNLSIANIPLLNPVRFRGVGWDDYFAYEIPFFESPTTHFQPWQQGDIIRLQFSVYDNHVNIGQPETWVTLCKCDTGVEVASFMYEVIRFVSGNEWNYTFILSVPVVTGDYFIKIKLPKLSTSDFYFWYSEGLNIKAAHTGTVMLRYTCDGIFHDMFFENPYLVRTYFYHRVKGGFHSRDFAPNSISNVYADQSHSFTLLSAVAFNTKKLTIGDNYGVPNYEADFINRALCCDSVTIDGVAYCKMENSNLEQVDYADNFPKGIWKIELAETPNSESITYNYTRPMVEDVAVAVVDLPDVVVTLNQADEIVIDISTPIQYPAMFVLVDGDGNTYPIGIIINSTTQIAVNLTQYKPATYSAKIIH